MILHATFGTENWCPKQWSLVSVLGFKGLEKLHFEYNWNWETSVNPKNLWSWQRNGWIHFLCLVNPPVINAPTSNRGRLPWDFFVLFVTAHDEHSNVFHLLQLSHGSQMYILLTIVQKYSFPEDCCHKQNAKKVELPFSLFFFPQPRWIFKYQITPLLSGIYKKEINKLLLNAIPDIPVPTLQQPYDQIWR